MSDVLEAVPYHHDFDYPLLSKWWKQWGYDPIPKDILPKNGFVIEQNGRAIVAAFYYMTDSRMAFYDLMISDKEVKSELKSEAIDFLIKTILQDMKKKGFRFLMCHSFNKRVIERHRQMDFTVDTKPMTLMFKGL